jgi:thymidylate kinase
MTAIKKFLNHVKKFAVFKEEYQPLGSKDLDLFIETKNFVDVERALTECFKITRCFYNHRFKQGTKRRYVVYGDDRFYLIDLGINAWYIRENEVMSFEEMSDLTINVNGMRILRPDFAKKLDKCFKGIIMSPGFAFLWFGQFIKRIFHNEGRIIAVVGPDGCGKTSVAKELTARLKVAFNAEYRYMGWQNHTGFTKAVYKVYKPHKPKKRLFPYYVEMMTRYASAWLKKRFLGRIIIMDRYFYDELKPSSLIPTPDYLFLLEASPDIIIKRKDELNKIKIEQVYCKYECIGKTLIDADKTVNHCVKEILDYLAPELINKKVVLE